MRLINAHTLELEEFWGENVKKYAILSHRWENDEVSFQAMQSPEVRSRKKGFGKIQKTCEQAVKDGLEYVWVDTCCINKDSSAELSEAINSMYRWYRASAVCYALLADVQDGHTVEQEMMSSLWFTRGWTLQELLAPQNLVFYNQYWENLGTKQSRSSVLSMRTGVDQAILNGEPIFGRSVAQRMSWASQRTTTRIEDTAYCLLGIFDVYMPLLYGEGDKSFLRLQEEIIKQSDDHSIFAWPIHRKDQTGLLADSPAAFGNCGHIRTMNSRRDLAPYSITNRGLSIRFRAIYFTADTYLVPLNCTDGVFPDGDNHGESRLGIFLRGLSEDDQYARVECGGKTLAHLKYTDWDEKWDDGTIVFHGSTQPFKQVAMNIQRWFTKVNTDYYKECINGFRIATHEILERSIEGDRFTVIADIWDPQERTMSIKPGCAGTVGVLNIRKQSRKIEIIKLGFDFDHKPVCFIAANIGKPIGTVLSGSVRQSIKKRDPLDTLPWSEIQDGGKSAIDLEHHPGLWAIKGDRINGIDAWLVMRHLKTIPAGKVGSLRIVRGEYHDKVVWNVYLDNV